MFTIMIRVAVKNLIRNIIAGTDFVSAVDHKHDYRSEEGRLL